MTEVSWSRRDGRDCIRLTGLRAGAEVRVRPATASAAGGLPPMAGRLVGDNADLYFLPRFSFIDGTAYSVAVDGAIVATLVRTRPDRMATTEVAGIWPTSAGVPRNLLRLYVWFTAPMSDGYAARQVRLTGDHGDTFSNALLPGEHELWDSSRRRLTVLLDPARIKRGLAAHEENGYPLRSGESFRLEVGPGFRDAQGLPLRAGKQRRYAVGDDERRHVDPRSWRLTAPRAGTCEPLRLAFGRPLDHALLARCLRATGPGGQPVSGALHIGPGEETCQLVPRRAWAPGPYQLVVDPALEDLAGNSVSRVFDRDRTRPEDRPRPAGPVALAFCPR